MSGIREFQVTVMNTIQLTICYSGVEAFFEFTAGSSDLAPNPHTPAELTQKCRVRILIQNTSGSRGHKIREVKTLRLHCSEAKRP